jgi:hypothetical protein
VYLAKSADPGEQSQELVESGAASAADCDCLLRKRQGLCAITKAEMRRGHRREHAAFECRKPTFLSDRQRPLQSFERIVPPAVQHVHEPEAEVGEHPPILVPRPLCVLNRLSAVR